MTSAAKPIAAARRNTKRASSNQRIDTWQTQFEGDPMAKKGTKRIRYAVAGQGYIAQAAVLPAFENAAQNSELVALISDDPAKLAKLARKYDVKHTYEV